jgi:hypothetical protein
MNADDLERIRKENRARLDRFMRENERREAERFPRRTVAQKRLAMFLDKKAS